MGKVYKDNYIVSNYIENESIYDTYYYYRNMFSGWDFYNNIENVEYENILKDSLYDIKRRTSDYDIGWCGRRYKDENDYIEKHLIRPLYFSAEHRFDKYEEFDTIETDIELRDDETIKIQGKSYQVQYEFNKDLNRHELYLNYEVRIEENEILKEKCKLKYDELCKKVEEYNKQVKETEIIIDNRFENFIKPNNKQKPTPPPVKVVYEDGGLLNKIKSWFNKKHE
jgi:hypothetical protein